MDHDPYRPPQEVTENNHHNGEQSRIITAVCGLMVGGMCGLAGGFCGGAMSGGFWRLFHQHVRYPNIFTLFGVFDRIATHFEFAVFQGSLTMIPLAVIGSLLGTYHGFRAGQRKLGRWQIIQFSVAALLIGTLNGILITNGWQFVVSQLLEGPIAGAVASANAGCIAWFLFCGQLNRFVSWPRKQQRSFVFSALLFLLCTISVIALLIPRFSLGTDAQQLTMRFVAPVSLSAAVFIVRILVRSKSK